MIVHVVGEGKKERGVFILDETWGIRVDSAKLEAASTRYLAGRVGLWLCRQSDKL